MARSRNLRVLAPPGAVLWLADFTMFLGRYHPRSVSRGAFSARTQRCSPINGGIDRIPSFLLLSTPHCLSDRSRFGFVTTQYLTAICPRGAGPSDRIAAVIGKEAVPGRASAETTLPDCERLYALMWWFFLERLARQPLPGLTSARASAMVSNPPPPSQSLRCPPWPRASWSL
jgi:hypothetical protein